MIRISTDRGDIDLTSDTSITLTIDNPLFEFDGIPTPYSTDIDIPKSHNNLEILNFPNINILNAPKLACTIYAGGVPIQTGVLKVMSVNENINVTFVGIPAYNIDTPLNKLGLGEYDVFTGSSTARETLNDLLCKKLNPKSEPEFKDDFVCAPLYAEANIFEVSDSSPTEIDKFFKTTVNAYHLYRNSYTFSEYSTTTAGYIEEKISFINPSVKVRHILSELFDEESLSFIPSSMVVTGGNVDWNGQKTQNFPDGKLRPNMYLPDMTLGSFLVEICKLLSLVVYTKNGLMHINSSSEILNSSDYIDWSRRIQDGYYSEIRQPSLYKYGYSEVYVNSSYNSSTPTQDVASISEMLNTPSEAEVLFEISSTSDIYKRTEKIITPNVQYCKYLLMKSGVYSYENNLKDIEDYTTSLLPINLSGEIRLYNRESYPYHFTNWFIPRMSFTRDNSSLYVGLLSMTDSYPLISATGASLDNSTISDMRLDFKQGSKISNAHQSMNNWLNKRRKVINGTIYLNINDVVNLDITKKVLFNGIMWFILSATMRIDHNSNYINTDVSLIEC